MLTTLALLVLGALPGGGVSIVLPTNAKSTGLEIAVADIATVEGEDEALVARVRAASLGYAPAPGFSRTLRADLVQASLRAALPGVDIEVVGAPRCRVEPEVRTLRGDELRARAAEAMRATLAGLDAEATPDGHVSDVLLPTSELEPRITVVPDSGELVPGTRNVQIQIWVGDRLYRTVHVPFRVALWQRHAVLRTAVNAGDALHAGLFEIKRVSVGESTGLYALPLDQLAGAVALKPMTAGAYVTERDVHRQVVIERGALVTVRVKKGGVEVSDVGIAESDGRMGERVRVTLRTTGRQLVATVRGRQLVEVTIQ